MSVYLLHAAINNGGYKFWAVTIILLLQFFDGYYYATITITGIMVLNKKCIFCPKVEKVLYI